MEIKRRTDQNIRTISGEITNGKDTEEDTENHTVKIGEKEREDEEVLRAKKK